MLALRIIISASIFMVAACGGAAAPEGREEAAAGRQHLGVPLVPSIQSFTATPNSITAGQTSTLAATYSNGSGNIDQGVGPIASGGTVPVAPTATTTYTLTVTGVLGLTATATATITVTPAQAPVVSITDKPANPTDQTTASFSFTADKPNCTFSCTLDSGAAAGCTSPKVYSGLAAGTHTFSVTATDPSGGVSAPASYTWTINPPSASIIPPGVPGGIPSRTTLCATLDASTYGNGTQDATAAIQAALDACPAGQVVQLAAGTFTVSSTVTLTKGVVLRGAGSQGAPSGTTLVKSGGGTVLAIGTDRDSTCYGGTGYALAATGAKEATSLSVGAAAANFQAGDLALVDAVDDASIQQGDCSYFKRVSGRSASQRVEVTAADTASGTLTLGSPLHWTFTAASPYLSQITRVTRPTTRWAGIESLRIQGGTNSSYNGAMAGGIDISNAAYCWVKDVQTDETIGGMHIALTGTYRCVVRDSVIHHSANYGFGTDCYGIVIRCGSAEALVENNVVRFMNKPILFNASGGGNVVAYNYADNSWSTPATWQEVNIDSHCAFPHMELIEGNWAPHMGASTTHGNAGYLTYLRNYASSKFASPAVVGSNVTQTGNVTSLEFDGGDLGMNVLGNVLGTAGWSTTYDAHTSGPLAIYQTGAAGSGAADIAFTSLFRHGNFDTVNNAVIWDPGTSSHSLPNSLYLGAKPDWWPAGTPWPWAGPDLSPMVGTLPAKQRSDAMGL